MLKPSTAQDGALAAVLPTVRPLRIGGVSSANPALLPAVLDSLAEDKAIDVLHIDLRGRCDFTDHMVIACGTSDRHVKAIAQHLADRMRDQNLPIGAIEGQQTANWIVVDAGDVVVHLFRPEVRTFYNIEKMWAEG